MFQKFLGFFVFFSLTLVPTLYADGASVLPMFARDGEAYIGLVKRTRISRRHSHSFASWSAFGGRSEEGETSEKTALRKFQDQTGRVSFPNITLNDIVRSNSLDFSGSLNHHWGHHHHGRHRHHHWGTHNHRLYFLDMRAKDTFSGHPITVQDIKSNVARSRIPLNRHHRGQITDWAVVKAADLLRSLPTDNDQVPGLTNPSNLGRRFKEILKQGKSQQILSAFVNSVRSQAAGQIMPLPLPLLVQPVVQKPVIKKTITGVKKPLPFIIQPKMRVVLTKKLPLAIVKRPLAKKIIFGRALPKKLITQKRLLTPTIRNRLPVKKFLLKSIRLKVQPKRVIFRKKQSIIWPKSMAKSRSKR